MSVISALGRLRQEGYEFQARLSYIGRSCLKKPKKKKARAYIFLLKMMVYQFP
jgi:hypothetical protein